MRLGVHTDVPKKLKTSEFYLEAVRQWGQALKFVPEELITPELCLAAVQQDAMTLVRYVYGSLRRASAPSKLGSLCNLISWLDLRK